MTSKFTVAYRGYRGDGPMITLNSKDVVVVNAGHHGATRPKYLVSYQKAFQCMKGGVEIKYKQWPHFLYAKSSQPHFWTTHGGFDQDQPFHSEKERNSCQENVAGSSYHVNENRCMNETVRAQWIGKDVDMKGLGELHPWHGDCLHWIQPGVSDVFAADIADYLVSHPSWD